MILAMTQAMAQQTLADRLEAEGDAVVGAFTSPWTWLVFAALVGVLIGSWWLRRLIGRNTKLSMQVKTQATTAISALTLVLSVVVLLFFLHRRAPLLTALSITLLGVIATVAIAIGARGWTRALIALWRGRIRVGDWLSISGIRGRVSDVGLFRVVIDADDGGQLYVPTNRFSSEIYAVASPERVFPVEVAIIDDQPLSEDDLEMLRRIATLSPYREWDSPLAIEPGAERGRATIRFRSWSEDGARMARTHLLTAFARARGR